MSNINDFKQFATSLTANVETQADYLTDPALDNGFQAGTANSQKLNKVWRQSSVIAAMIGQFIANAGLDALDNGNAVTLLEAYLNAKDSFLSKSVAGGANVTLDPYLEANNSTLYFTGVLTANIVIFVPASRDSVWNIINATSGPFTLEIRVTGASIGSGTIIAQGSSSLISSNGSVIYAIGSGGGGSGGTGVIPGSIILFAGSAVPLGYLQCPGALTNVSRITYAALFAAIGTTWGVGDGSTTFGLPWFPSGYAPIQTYGAVGAQTIGSVVSHTHSGSTAALRFSGSNSGFGPVSAYFAPDAGGPFPLAVTVPAAGGPSNLAAGVTMLFCVKY